jgi:hypothetical protein
LGVVDYPQKHFGRNQNAALRQFPNGVFGEVNNLRVGPVLAGRFGIQKLQTFAPLFFSDLTGDH